MPNNGYEQKNEPTCFLPSGVHTKPKPKIGCFCFVLFFAVALALGWFRFRFRFRFRLSFRFWLSVYSARQKYRWVRAQ